MNFRNTLYWRLSFGLLALLLLVAITYIVITANTARNYFQETTQRLNANVAGKMLMEVQPFTDDGKVNEEALGKIMHSMMAVNPSLEVYLLSPEGEILSFVVFDKKVKLAQIDLAPVLRFIETKGENLVLGDDPRQPGKKTIFSATPVKVDNNLLGYVYMVLASEQYETIAGSLVNSYGMQLGATAFVVTLAFAFILGMLLIWVLTSNLRIILRAVRAFEIGNTHERIPEQKVKGEMAVLARTFNTMAETIERNINSLTQVDQLRRELIANVSHDLRSPLTVIQGYIETMQIKQETLSEADRRQYLTIISETGRRLNKLVTDLFDLSKLESGQVELNKESFSLMDMMSNATFEYQLLADKKGIRINSEYGSDIPLAFADAALIQRVVQNLIDNAIKYTPEGGEINLEVSRHTPKEVMVKIANSGKGIEEPDRRHIFDRYYKIDKQQKGVQGSGLGLAIVKKIMEVHHAPIYVTSKPGATTTFSFILPAA
jgi:signal transduction histidine kinase